MVRLRDLIRANKPCKAKYWSSKNKVTPRDVFKSTQFKYYFICDKCKSEFLMSLSNISRGNQWCPSCVNKTEKILHNWLFEKYGE